MGSISLIKMMKNIYKTREREMTVYIPAGIYRIEYSEFLAAINVFHKT